MRVIWHDSLESVDRCEWNSLFPNAPENWDFYRAVENAPPAGFALGAVTVRSAQGHLLAGAPCFSLSYRLDTSFQGSLRKTLNWLSVRGVPLPRVIIFGIGSPLSDNCSLGFADGLCEQKRHQVIKELIAELCAKAAIRRGAVVLVKGLTSDATLQMQLSMAGFTELRSLPVVMLRVPQPSLDAYLQNIKRQHRHYFRNKLKTLPLLKVEFTQDTLGLERDMVALYQATLQQSGVSYGDFDEIGSDYIRSFLAAQPQQAHLMLIWRGTTLVSFHLFHAAGRRLISNKMGMRYPQARELNLYFINWLKIVEFATERGFEEIEMGATTYAAKLLFGGRLERRFLHFRFTNSVIHRLSRPLHGLFDFERNDPELKKLRREGHPALSTLD